MDRKFSFLAMVSVLAIATPAAAQDDQQDQLLAELAQMRAQMAEMAARIDHLQGELEAVEGEAAAAREEAQSAETAVAAVVQASDATDIVFKGAPQITAEGGWSFKPRGRLQFDAGVVNSPDSTGRSDGFGSEARRIRLGVAGDIPGGFGYKFEADFAGNDLSVTDAIISYETGNVEILVGQQNTFQGLEELTSSLHTSFIERSAFTDAFNFERRVGVSAIVETGDVLLQGGVFSDNAEDLSNQNWSLDGRAVFAPKLGDTQLHFGGSVHFADLETGSTVRFRQRPLVHFTSERFINTDFFDANSEFGVGLESAAIAGPFHVSAEAFWQSVDVPFTTMDPTFFGGSIEAGYFLTDGDSRGYKGGKFDRVKPNNPVGEGGAGSVQVNVRYDHLDLTDAGIIGGTQNGYMVSIVWKPTDYTLLLANYGRLEYDDAVFPLADGSTSYGVDAFGVRAQIDF
ncbi:MAG: porin [Erythrobacter sp.]